MSGNLADQVSVLIPVRDGVPYVGESIESILAQTTPPGEIVVVDDGSTDDTPDVLRSFGAALRVVRQPPLGIADALNNAIALAKGALLAFLDADDLWTPESLEVRLARLAQSDAPDAVFGRMVQFVSPELGPEAETGFRYDPGPSVAHLFQNMVIRRTAFEAIGPLDSGFPSAANVDWMSRAQLARLRAVYIDDVVSRRRLHRSNMGVTMGKEKLRILAHVVRAHHERARALGVHAAPTPASDPEQEGQA
jgi:glycosyltransferase involved in cell wall biosynthesis